MTLWMISKRTTSACNIPLELEKIIEDNLSSVEEAMADLKQAWKESLAAEEKFKSILRAEVFIMAYETAITLKKAIDNIKKRHYVLPSIQREFVWDTGTDRDII